jgi:hypothetical protein
MPVLFFKNHVFDPDIFVYRWQQEPDLIRREILNSGVMVPDGRIRTSALTGGNKYTIPYYNLLDSTDPIDYNGVTDMPFMTNKSNSQTGVVRSKMQGFDEDTLTRYLTGNDPFRNLISQVATWWRNYDLRFFIKFLGALLDSTPTDAAFATSWQAHTMDLSATGTPTDDNLIGPSTVNDITVEANGDNSNIYAMAIMHSRVANRLANLQLLNYWTYTDPNGMQRRMGLADVNGLLCIINDSVPVVPDGANRKYTTFVLGRGTILTAGENLLPANEAAEYGRDMITRGGVDQLATRVRSAMHPNGFTFKADIANAAGATDTEMLAPANWDLKWNPKSIAISRVITNG